MSVLRAREYWLKYVQSLCFSDDIDVLLRGKVLSKSSRIKSLDPYLDPQGLLRVGGRIQDSVLPFDCQHPIILGNHFVTRLLIANAHLRTLHGGSTLTLRLLFERFWIVRAKVLVKSVIAHCVPCTRSRGVLCSQRMANLPEPRVTRSRPFQHVGVDYAGPVAVKSFGGRGFRAHKAYIAVFVCLSIRAIHLELVFDYTSNTFLAAFKRFCARRGQPTTLYSDNGTTFVGASRELGRSFGKLQQDPNLATFLLNDGIEWKFIPPSSPHFGGLWEAGVKSVKFHLHRIIGDHTLSGEEFATLLCQVEACLNFRPIAGFSDDPDDLSYLTPGHFLIGAPILAPPEHSVLNISEGRLSRWKLVQLLSERFWSLWSKEYLRTLQKRHKWQTRCPNLSVGDIVLLQNDNLPPTKWDLGRVLECYPGHDGLVRVCSVKTAQTTLTRPIHKLCKLPTALED